jgi:HNH endonuclease
VKIKSQKPFKTRGPKPISMDVLFWGHVKKGRANECWIWEGTKSTFGYGSLKSHQKKYDAHRVSYELHKGIIPSGKLVCHSCDNPSCCNPKHLWLGTHQDNVTDMISKGRRVQPDNRGQKNGRTKLTEKQVLAIRKDDRSTTVIGREYGVSGVRVSQIKRNKGWNHI